MKFEVRNSTISDKGLFAVTTIKSYSYLRVVIYYTGVIMNQVSK